MLAVECLSLCGATGGTCDLTVTLTRFEKWGCANAAASGQPGFNCDYVLGYSLSGLMMQQMMSAFAPNGARTNSRFVQQGGRWVRMATPEK